MSKVSHLDFAEFGMVSCAAKCINVLSATTMCGSLSSWMITEAICVNPFLLLRGVIRDTALILGTHCNAFFGDVRRSAVKFRIATSPPWTGRAGVNSMFLVLIAWHGVWGLYTSAGTL